MASSKIKEASNISIQASQGISGLLARSSRDILWVQAVDKKELLFISPSVETVLGVSISDLRADSDFLVSLVHEDDREALQNARERVLGGEKEVLDKSYRIVRPDGRQRWLYERGSVVREEANASDQYVGIATDITGEVQPETQAVKHLMELAHTSRVITMGEMATGLAHELNQPLAAIAHYADSGMTVLGKPKPSVERLKSLFEKLMEQALRAGSIVQRLRSLVKKNPSRLSFEDISDITRNVVALVGAEVRLNSIHVEMVFDEKLPLVLVDRVLIEQVILNIIRNAIDAMQETNLSQREISISAAVVGDMVEIAIADTGTGPGEEVIDKYFDAFFTTKDDGLGMGLAISRSIIEKHGGRLWGSANSGRGLTMHFTLSLGGDVDDFDSRK